MPKKIFNTLKILNSFYLMACTPGFAYFGVKNKKSISSEIIFDDKSIKTFIKVFIPVSTVIARQISMKS